MTKYTTYKITYWLEFNGETIEGSYIKTVTSFQELMNSIKKLETDDHIFKTRFEEVQEDD